MFGILEWKDFQCQVENSSIKKSTVKIFLLRTISRYHRIVLELLQSKTVRSRTHGQSHAYFRLIGYSVSIQRKTLIVGEIIFLTQEELSHYQDLFSPVKNVLSH